METMAGITMKHRLTCTIKKHITDIAKEKGTVGNYFFQNDGNEDYEPHYENCAIEKPSLR